jgi:hypothetical protein
MTINVIDYFILALATYRLTRLVTTDTVFERAREAVWKKFPPHKGGIGYLITCNWCASIWVASLVFSMYKISTEPVIFVSTILSLSAFAGFLSRAG